MKDDDKVFKDWEDPEGDSNLMIVLTICVISLTAALMLAGIYA